mmetsp:Transcript_44526/g.142783  ORF Transcript_44526/g.142783 Transcript_44526/m.142783 type:complete len:237 (-) Transcript_44526:1501-2211(-)
MCRESAAKVKGGNCKTLCKRDVLSRGGLTSVRFLHLPLMYVGLEYSHRTTSCRLLQAGAASPVSSGSLTTSLGRARTTGDPCASTVGGGSLLRTCSLPRAVSWVPSRFAATTCISTVTLPCAVRLSIISTRIESGKDTSASPNSGALAADMTSASASWTALGVAGPQLQKKRRGSKAPTATTAVKTARLQACATFGVTCRLASTWIVVVVVVLTVVEVVVCVVVVTNSPMLNGLLS